MLAAEVLKVGTWDCWGYEDDVQLEIRLRITLKEHSQSNGPIQRDNPTGSASKNFLDSGLRRNDGGG